MIPLNYPIGNRPNTMELRNCVPSPKELFDFEYDFYTNDEDLKTEFETLFYENYFFREIGQETYDRFKFMLRSRLNMKMKYYRQLYQSEIDAYEIGWLTQKDLQDTFERELDNTTNINNQSEDITKATNKNLNDSFFSDTPSSKVDDIEDFMSNASRDKGTNENDVTSNSTTKGLQTGKVLEKTTYRSKGQIGVQTVAQPVQWWREQMLNINEMLIDECSDLFYLIY